MSYYSLVSRLFLVRECLVCLKDEGRELIELCSENRIGMDQAKANYSFHALAKQNHLSGHLFVNGHPIFRKLFFLKAPAAVLH